MLPLLGTSSKDRGGRGGGNARILFFYFEVLQQHRSWLKNYDTIVTIYLVMRRGSDRTGEKESPAAFSPQAPSLRGENERMRWWLAVFHCAFHCAFSLCVVLVLCAACAGTGSALSSLSAGTLLISQPHF